MDWVYRILGVVGLLGKWGEEATQPDEDGIRRIDFDELVSFLKQLFELMGWKVEVTLPDGTKKSIE